jgi:Zn ribbon nucleic-acid-binding protein
MMSPETRFDTSAPCPKCHGVLRLDEYQGEPYAQCIQCGYLRFLARDGEREPQMAGNGRSRHAASRR